MANSDKNILITPSVGLSTNPTIKFNGANNTPTTLRVLDDGTISFEGTAGQLFSISDGLTGSIFSVNDISGIPSIEVLDTGLVKINQYSGSTVFGASAAIQSSSVNAKVSISTASATTPGLIIKAASSQTASIQEWQDSSGNVKSKILADGSLFVGGGSYTKIDSTYGQVAIRNDNLIGSLTVGTSATSVVGIVVRPVASQTADLQQWQDNTGTVLAKVASNGYITSGVFYANSNFYANYQIIGGRAASDVLAGSSVMGMANWNTAYNTLQLRNVASQTADSIRIENSSGTALTRVDAQGRVVISTDTGVENLLNVIQGPSSAAAHLVSTGAGYLGWIGQRANWTRRFAFESNPSSASGSNFGLWQYDSSGANPIQVFGTSYGNGISIYGPSYTYSSGASSIVSVIRGTTSQTADLQQWQNSAATVLAKVDSSGNFGINVSSPAARLDVGQAVDMTILSPSVGIRSIAYVNANNGTTTGYINSSTSTLYVTTKSGSNLNSLDDGYVANGSGIVVNGDGTVNQLISIMSSGTLYSGSITNYIGFKAKTTANYGTNTIGSSFGIIIAAQKAAHVTTGFGIVQEGLDDYNLFKGRTTIQSGAATYTPLSIKGAASQSANLQEWQDSTGAVLASISPAVSSAVTLKFTDQYSFKINWGNESLLSTESGKLVISPWSADRAALIVKGRASQSANLQEWQTSDGTVRTIIGPNGTVGTKDNVYAGRYYYSTNGTSTGTSISFIDGIGSGGLSIRNIDLGTANSAFDSITPLTVSGNVNQTGDLQRWNNGAGTVLSKVDSSGNINTTKSFVQTGTIGTTYAVDASGNQATYAANATVDFPNFSGMILIDCQNDGALSLWLCGGGSATRIGGSKTGANDGTMAYNSGINGYTWTNANTAQNVNITAIRTRSGA
jgi:hypothetical protein